MHDFLAEPQTAAFWLGLLEIIGINIVLSGDNAVVIALAARQLQPAQRRMAVVAGAGGAVALRVALTLFATNLLQLAWVKTVGGLLLLWIASKLKGRASCSRALAGRAWHGRRAASSD